MDITKMAEGWIPLGESVPDGMKKCPKCGRTLPKDEFYVNALRNARFATCKECFADESMVLGRRLAWYVSDSHPAGIPNQIGIDARANSDWLIANAETGDGMRTIIKARNMKAPYEEAGDLIERGVSPHVLRGDIIEDDPHAGLNRRLAEFYETFGGV